MRNVLVGTGVAFLYSILGYGYWLTIERQARGVAVSPNADDANPRSPRAGADAVARELERFRGTWQLISSEMNGEASPPEQLENVRVTFDGDRHTICYAGRVIAHSVKFTIDPTSNPKSTEDSLDREPHKGRKIRGIYSLEQDLLISCVGTIDGNRPTGFAAPAGTGWTLRKFRRMSSGAGVLPSR
jgi:uncharacterized protein (TIGR03067 family)